MLSATAAAGAPATLASAATVLAAVGIRASTAPAVTSAAAAAARRCSSSQASTSAGVASASSSTASSSWTSWLPWGRKLTGTEKFYYGMFVVAASLITWRRWSQRETEEMRQERLKKEAELEVQRKEFLRAVLAGRSFLEGDDPFQGMRPRQIEQYVEEHKGELSVEDPFEGMTPEEIDEYVAKHGLQALPPSLRP